MKFAGIIRHQALTCRCFCTFLARWSPSRPKRQLWTCEGEHVMMQITLRSVDVIGRWVSRSGGARRRFDEGQSFRVAEESLRVVDDRIMSTVVTVSIGVASKSPLRDIFRPQPSGSPDNLRSISSSTQEEVYSWVLRPWCRVREVVVVGSGAASTVVMTIK